MKEKEPRTTEARYRLAGGSTWLSYPDLDHPGLVHGILVCRTTDPGLGRRAWVRLVSAILASAVDPRPERIVIPDQVHSSSVRAFSRISGSEDVVCDGLTADEPGVLIGVSVADCIPLFGFNRSRRSVGIAHCGWRGIAGGMVEAFSKAMSSGGDISHTTYLVGASIGGCCYEVGPDLLARFRRSEIRDHVNHRQGKTYLDLKALVASKLMIQGMPPQNISIDKACTACQKYILSSYRASGGRCGRMLAFLMLTG